MYSPKLKIMKKSAAFLCVSSSVCLFRLEGDCCSQSVALGVMCQSIVITAQDVNGVWVVMSMEPHMTIVVTGCSGRVLSRN